jgi:hypothetical protein
MSKILHPEGESRLPCLILDSVVANSRLVLWAQRSSTTEDEKNIVYLSVNAVDLQHPKVDLSASGVTVEGVQKGTEAVYKVALEFFEDVDVSVPSPLPLPLYLFDLRDRCLNGMFFIVALGFATIAQLHCVLFGC